MTARTLLVCSAVLASGAVFAQEDAGADDAALADLPKPSEKAEIRHFMTLPLCRHARGTVEVLKPVSKTWEEIEEGKFYPLGSSYRTGADGSLVLAFGAESLVKMQGDSAFGTRAQPLDKPGELKTRTVILSKGTIELSLPQNLPEGAFVVTSPGFTAKNPTRESKFTFTSSGDSCEATVRCVSGSLAVDGNNFSIPRMQAANEFAISTSRDNLVAELRGLSGDFIVKLDRGIITTSEIDGEGQVKQVSEQAFLDWHLSPQTRVLIHRGLPSVGERMSVAVMTFDPAGTMKNNFAFSEGRAEVNTGELVRAPKGEGEEIARKAAEATEEAAADVEDTKAEEETEDSSDE